MAFDRTAYFNSVRASMFSGAMSQQQVDGQNAILSQWEAAQTGTPMTDLRWLAYMLATTYHETAQKMWPIEEYGKGSGKPYGKKDAQTGQTYYGRGFVQLTWRDNYHKATVKLALADERDIEWHAEQALDLVIASRVMFRGMAEGWFTDNKLGDFFNASTDDPVGARIIINNDVSKMGKTVAGYHAKFLTALQAAWIDEPVPTPPTQEPVVIDITLPAEVPLTLIVNGNTLVDGRY